MLFEKDMDDTVKSRRSKASASSERSRKGVYLDFVFVVIDVVEAQTDTWWKNVPSLLNL